MNDAARVRRVQRLGERDRVIDERQDRERTGRQHLVQRRAREQLHHEIGTPVGRADIEERADVRVIEGRNGAPLALEPREGVRRLRRRRENLDRNLAAQSRVGPSIDLAHAAFAKLLNDAVRAEG